MIVIYDLLPPVAVVLFVAGTIRVALRPAVGGWSGTAAIAAALAAWTVHAVATGGPLGFWPNHTQDAWGNQVWFDLLIALGLGWALVLPRARAVGMRPWPWLAALCLSGSIGLAAMIARCRYLEIRTRTPVRETLR